MKYKWIRTWNEIYIMCLSAKFDSKYIYFEIKLEFLFSNKILFQKELNHNYQSQIVSVH